MEDIHRSEKLDKFIGKRVSIQDFEKCRYSGVLKYEYGKYVLTNVFDEKRGFMHPDIAYRKSNIISIKER